MTQARPFIIFGAPLIGEAEIEEVVATLRSGWLGTGPRVAQFVQEFLEYTGAPFGTAVNSCTAALHLSMLAAGIGPGDEVITTPMTFCATVNAIIHTGATPVLVDIEPDSFNIDPNLIESAVTARTRAIVPVHFAGRACKMDLIQAIAVRHNLLIIEDCAHAIETEYHGQKAGTFGHYGCFSFYVTKNVVTAEGGMIVTKDEEAIDRARILALHGMSKDAWKRFSDEGYKHYYVVDSGFKYNMTDLQAAIGIHQLRRVEENWQKRAQLWAQYSAALSDLPLTLPVPPEPGTRHAHHLFTVRVNAQSSGISRDEMLTELTKRRIGVGVHYLSIPEHPFYQERFGWHPDDYPVAAQVGKEILSLPLSPKLSGDDMEYIIAQLHEIMTT